MPVATVLQLKQEFAKSELRGFGKVELADLHGWRDHVHGLFAARAHRLAHFFNVLQHVNQAFVKAEVPDPTLNLAVLDQECAVARHAG